MAKWLSDTIDTINNRLGMILSLGILLPLIAITAYEVICRFAFNNPTNWVLVTTQQAFAIYVILGGGYTLLQMGHVKSDIFWSRLSLRNRAITDLATGGFAFLFLGVMLWFIARAAYLSTLIREHAVGGFTPPLYPLKICLAIGVFFTLLQFIAKAIRDFQLVTKGVELD